MKNVRLKFVKLEMIGHDKLFNEKKIPNVKFCSTGFVTKKSNPNARTTGREVTESKRIVITKAPYSSIRGMDGVIIGDDPKMSNIETISDMGRWREVVVKMERVEHGTRY